MTEENSDGRFTLPMVILGAYFVGVVGWLAWVRRTPGQCSWRKSISLTADLGLAVLGMHLLGGAGSLDLPGLSVDHHWQRYPVRPEGTS